MGSNRLLVGLIVCGLLIGCCVAGCTTTPSTNATPTPRTTTAAVTGTPTAAPASGTPAATSTPVTTGAGGAEGTVTPVATATAGGAETPASTAPPMVTETIRTLTPTPTGTEYIDGDSSQVPDFIYYSPSGSVTSPVTTTTTAVPNATVTTLVPTATTLVPTATVTTPVPTVTTVLTTSVATAVTTTPGTETIPLTTQNLAFSTSTITVRAGEQVTIAFNNMDAGVLHNLPVYTDASATTAIFTSAIVTGPTTTTYTFTAPSQPGNYFFRCDVHPTTMTGTFVVQ